MTRKTIDFLIDEDGNITQVVHGVSGPSCQKTADAYKDLGKRTLDRKTAEYGTETATSSTIKQRR